MSIYSNLPKKKNNRNEIVLRRTFLVEEDLYQKLQYLSDNIYDVSVNKLVIIAIEELIKTEDITLYTTDKKSSKLDRTYLISEKMLNSLKILKEKYNISMVKLVNIAIYNALNKNK